MLISSSKRIGFPHESSKNIKVKKTEDFFTFFLFCPRKEFVPLKLYLYKEGNE